MTDLEGKIAIITGSTRGIGNAIALELARKKAIVLLHGLKESSVSNESINKVRAISPKSKIYYANIEDPNKVSRMARAIQKDFKYIDILVNNAGIHRSSPFLRMTNQDWNAVIKVNLYGTFYVTKALLPLIIKAKKGRIINISSVYGLIGEYGLTNYCASKAAIIGFTKALSKEVAKNNITVNAVCPGLIDTGMINDIPKKDLNQRMKQIPMGKIGTKEDVAKLVAFISSEDAGYITGQAISINGGMY